MLMFLEQFLISRYSRDAFAGACTFVILCLLNYRLCNIDSSMCAMASFLQKFAAAVNILKAVDINCTRRYIASGKSSQVSYITSRIRYIDR